MRQKTVRNCTAILLIAAVLTGCAGSSPQTPDDYATNEGYTSTEASAQTSDSKQTNISKDDMKVGVLYISDPSEGSGYSGCAEELIQFIFKCMLTNTKRSDKL